MPRAISNRRGKIAAEDRENPVRRREETSIYIGTHLLKLLAILCFAAFASFAVASGASARTYASMVMDARNGEVLFSRNANAVLHPASLTKMMTMYVAFEAVEKGEIGLDDMIKVSRRAASEPPSILGLKPGTRIRFRYLLRAAAVRSANDAATAIAEAVSGSVEAFTRRMNRTAKAMGMNNTNFKNAHGLTQSGHKSSARDMTILGRHLIYDFEEYYNMYSRETTHAGIRTVKNTNRRLLGAYKGADGIKTGFTNAAGFNLVASAKRGDVRIIATVFGGKTSASRNKHVMELLDKGFALAKRSVRLNRPSRPAYNSRSTGGSLAASIVPIWRPSGLEAAKLIAATAAADSAEQGSVSDELGERFGTAVAEENSSNIEAVLAPTPIFRPVELASRAPSGRNSAVVNWKVTVGKFPTSYLAEKQLIAAGLIVHRTIPGVDKTIVATKYYFQPSFINLSESEALTACKILAARDIECHAVAAGE